MATSTISNTILDPTGTALSGVSVQVRLMPSGGFRSDTFTEVARLETTTTNASGFWSLALERNSNITPGTTSTWYEVTEFIPDTYGGKRVWLIQVGASDQTVLASLVTPSEQQPTVVPAGTVYLTQAAADARYQALGSLSSSAPNTIEPDDAASAGVSTSASRADHEHGIVAAAPSNIGLAGTNSEGAATSFARSNHVHAYNPPACALTDADAQSLTNNTLTDLIFNDTDVYDTDTMHNPAVNPERITFNTAGVYLITGYVTFATDTDITEVLLRILIDGTTDIGQHRVAGTLSGFEILAVTGVTKVTAGQFVTLNARQVNTSAGANSVTGRRFTATWIGVG